MKLSGTVRPHLFGLLYVGDAGERPMNLGRSRRDPIEVYLQNAMTLSASATAAGMEFTLLTNRAGYLQELARKTDHHGLNIAEIEFKLRVPSDIPFSSAHHKLDAIRELGSGRFGDYVALIDIDCVILKPLELPDSEGLWTYDITDQVGPAYGASELKADLDFIAGRELPNFNWYGGEFLAGRARGFADLWERVDALWGRYLSRVREFQLVGDEAIVSAALGDAEGLRLSLMDGHSEGLVIRWWSGRTLTPGPQLSEALRYSAIHLPQDKAFLANFAYQEFHLESFLDAYRSHVRLTRRSALAKNAFDLLRMRRPQFVAKLP